MKLALEGTAEEISDFIVMLVASEIKEHRDDTEDEEVAPDVEDKLKRDLSEALCKAIKIETVKI